MQNSESINHFDKMRVKRAAEYFDVSQSFIRHALMDRRLSTYRLGRTVYVSRTEIESFINSNVEKAVNNESVTR